tara:strand:+ start:77 stop:541 length:465 start_codon:yes stop_codon:yes gene_type:complete
MKKMKLFCGILIGFIILSSCSSDDDSTPTPETISIVGVWKPIKQVNVCSTGNEEIVDFTACLQMSRLTFDSNGTLNNMEYSDDTGSCLENFGNGTWTLTEDNLSLNINGDISNPTFFELTNNTLQIGFFDSDPSNPCDGGNLRSLFYTEYTRVE